MRTRFGPTGHRRRVLASAVLAIVTAAGLTLVVTGAAQASSTYQVVNLDQDATHGVFGRDSANLNDVKRDSAHYLTYGTNIQLVCAEFGSPVGPSNNTAWDVVRVLDGPNAGLTTHLSEHWLSTPVSSGQHVAGEPACGSSPASAPAPAPSGSVNTPIWVGAPFAGYWPGGVNGNDSLPANHTPIFTVYGHNYKGDWAMDYYARAGTPAYLYAAPKNSALNNAVTAKVLTVRATCGSGNISNGGYQVHVGLYASGTRVGEVAIGHLSPDFNHDGVTNSADINYRGAIARWGGYLGTVGAYPYNSCYQVRTAGGQHVHIELTNESHYACYRPGMAGHQAVGIHDYIGYLGGNYATTRHAACPYGA